MAKKTRLPGFTRPLELDYQIPQSSSDEKETYWKVARFSLTDTPGATVPNYSTSFAAQVLRQNIIVRSLQFAVYAYNSVTGVNVAIDNVNAYFNANGGLSYPQGIFANNGGTRVVASGNPYQKNLKVDLGEDGIYIPTGSTLNAGLEFAKAAGFAANETIEGSLIMIWR